MNVEPKRVKKVDSPLLIIGLGGTGSDALLTIMDKFKQRFELPLDSEGQELDAPERTAYLAFDTDRIEMEGKQIGTTKFRQEHMFTLQIPERLGVGAIPAYITSWWDQTLTGYEIRNGAGGIRQAGRFVVFHNADSIVNKLNTVIQNLIALPANQAMSTLEIVLTTGISGGTGSGSFLDMAYLIRYVLNTHYPHVSTNFTAYILTPEVNVDKIPGIAPSKRDMLETTGFAALKELDFWMNYNTHQYPFTQRYSNNIEVKWDSKPFDNVILMSNQKIDGTIIQDSYNNCLDVLSESVLNFYADEPVGPGGQIALRSHLSNISGELQFLHKNYPANYTYMSVGAAASGDLKDLMVTYEAKKTMQRISELKKVDKVLTDGSRHAAPLLGEREGEKFLRAVYPEELNFYKNFSVVLPDLGYFSDPDVDPRTVHDGPAIHEDMYEDWKRQCGLSAKEFAVEEVRKLESRFFDMVRQYVTDLNYGPYVTTEFLRDDDKGFVGFFNRVVALWQSNEDSCLTERNNVFTDVKEYNYPEMANMGGLQMTLGLWGPVTKYKDACERLFSLERDYELAKEMNAEMRDLQKRVNAYCGRILPAFCKLLDDVNANLDNDLKLMSNAEEGTNIASSKQILSFVDTVFGETQQDGVARDLLTTMVNESLTIRLNSIGTVEGMEEAREQFEKAADHFIQTATSTLNGTTMDYMLDIIMPGASQQDKIDYLSQHLLPDLKMAAQTMLPLTQKNVTSREYIPYAYTSVPNNAPLIQQGVQAFQATEKITPKFSDVTDRIYWLNTLNCIPMYMFVSLPRLESVYENSLVNLGAKGLHLVYAPAGGTHELYNDWSLLPSPVVHELQTLMPPKTVKERHKMIETMFEKALSTGAARLGNQAGKEQLTVVVKYDENGNIETMEQFEAKLAAVVNNPNLSVDEKVTRLEAIRDDGKAETIDYIDYSDIFAAANNLILTAAHNTTEEIERAEKNRMTARIHAAEYILYSWKPQLAEQMISQQAMREKANELIEQIRPTPISDEFFRGFMGLYLIDTFSVGRMAISFKDVRGNTIQLISKGDLTDEELTALDFCDALVLARILSNAEDQRINPTDRHYLTDKINAFVAGIDEMTDAEYNDLKAKAKDFITKYEKTPDEIRYARGELSKADREKLSNLMEALLRAVKIFK